MSNDSLQPTRTESLSEQLHEHIKAQLRELAQDAPDLPPGDFRRQLELFAAHGADARFYLKVGRYWPAQALPSRYPRGAMKQCYQNAAMLASFHPELTYVEGYALSGLPLHHAWCVDEAGRVVDNTWDAPEKSEYFGVAIERQALKKELLRNGYWGIFCSLPPEAILSGRFHELLDPRWHPDAEARGRAFVASVPAVGTGGWVLTKKPAT